jgi:hypothetical protein
VVDVTVGDRIEAEGAARPAPQETTRGQPGTSETAVDLDGLRRVLRATRRESTRRRLAEAGNLIGADRHQGNLPGQPTWAGAPTVGEAIGNGGGHDDVPVAAISQARSWAEVADAADGDATTR